MRSTPARNARKFQFLSTIVARFVTDALDMERINATTALKTRTLIRIESASEILTGLRRTVLST